MRMAMKVAVAQIATPIWTVRERPMYSAAVPAMNLPTGSEPPKTKVQIPITRPRNSSGTRVWMMLLAVEKKMIIPAPANRSVRSAALKSFISVKVATAEEKRRTPQKSRLCFFLILDAREATVRAPTSAPIPLNVSIFAYPVSPIAKMSFAKAGRRTIYEKPNMTTDARSASSPTMRGSLFTYANPSSILFQNEEAVFGVVVFSTLMSASATTTGMYERLFRRKQYPMPTAAITIPATAGPTMRALLKIPELSPMAFIRSFLPTISMMKDWRAGISKATIRPRMPASVAMCHTSTVPVRTRMASMKGGIIAEDCVMSRSVLLGNLSARTPPKLEKSSKGRVPTIPTTPSISFEPVIWYTSHPCAVHGIQVPTNDTNCPKKKRR